MAKSKNDLDISVLIATYNRAEILRQTLESMAGLERDGLSVEFVVVDNNSSDDTKEVIESFIDRLPIRYLFEPRPGKNCALNKALNEVPLGKLVAFTDDDVESKKDWLKTIITVTNRWPDYSVFGGKIYAIWPNGKPPIWAQSRSIQALGFAIHDYEDSECPYKSGQYPFGPNFWVRREVFEAGHAYDESVGPRPQNRIMGSETSFLKRLTDQGYGIVYSPDAIMGHHIQPSQMSRSNILKRAYRWGRAIARMQPLCRLALLDKHPVLWRLVRKGAIVRLSFLLITSLVLLVFNKPEKAVRTMQWIGYNIESMRMAGEDCKYNVGGVVAE